MRLGARLQGNGDFSRHGLLEQNAAVHKLLGDIGYCFIDIVKLFSVA
jgi:hypothetical protein